MSKVIKGLVLAGGRSTRMGTEKAFLNMKGIQLYEMSISLLAKHCQDVALSIRREQQISFHGRQLHFIHDKNQDIGPAAGILAAHEHDAEAYWFVLACDFPCLTEAAIDQLIEEFRSEREMDILGFHSDRPEPLFAIWSPRAIKALAKNVQAGKTGPMYTIQHAGLICHYIAPEDISWLINTNTPEEFQAVQEQKPNNDII